MPPNDHFNDKATESHQQKDNNKKRNVRSIQGTTKLKRGTIEPLTKPLLNVQFLMIFHRFQCDGRLVSKTKAV